MKVSTISHKSQDMQGASNQPQIKFYDHNMGQSKNSANHRDDHIVYDVSPFIWSDASVSTLPAIVIQRM